MIPTQSHPYGMINEAMKWIGLDKGTEDMAGWSGKYTTRHEAKSKIQQEPAGTVNQ